jgi:hypothetical protein
MNDFQYNLLKALAELASDIKKEIHKRISEYGANRNGKNTLENSNLERSIDVKVINDHELAFEIADYYQAVVNGWNGFTGRYPGTLSDAIDKIGDWAVSKGLVKAGQNKNRVAWAVFKAIIQKGVPPRPFLGFDASSGERIGEPAKGDPSVVLPFLDDYFDKWADEVFNKITEELDKYFT